MMENKFYVFS